ncbi:MAG: hypothetical protein F6K22_36390 [Okeania sp. SIO2F4]|uniref:hypothetical protein n=1 Tax=Okeania sp. SIO2F4 TaxID=2607790 RepID=UPI001428F4D4|nr:hypothetical protein [Okeania sp. SIO2F4]NES07792.1 hypothetical protein [Okeania sp. SIO2F4]
MSQRLDYETRDSAKSNSRNYQRGKSTEHIEFERLLIAFNPKRGAIRDRDYPVLILINFAF